MSNVLYLIEVVIALGLVILVHELGHFLAAKRFGVRVRRFAIGMGSPIVKWTRGETEYSLRWIPVGGFVDLVGEHPDAEEADDPKALWRRPPWQRTVIFAAGVVLNVVLAMVLFAVAPVVGIRAPVPVVGGVEPSLPAAKAGIQPGDRILAINGDAIESFEDIFWTVALTRAGTTFEIALERPAAEAGAPPMPLTITVASVRSPGSLGPMIGVGPEQEPVFADILHEDTLVHQAGLRRGDRVRTVDGREVATWRGLEKALADAPAGPVALGVERDGKPFDLRVNPADLKVYEYGLTFTTEITAVEADSPAAAAGVQTGDRVAAIEGKPWPTTEMVAEAVKAAGSGGTLRLTLWRDGQLLDVACRTADLPGSDHPRMGVGLGPALGAPLLVGHVDAQGPADEAGLRAGDEIVAAGDEGLRPDDWGVLSKVLLTAGDRPIPLQVRRGASELSTTLRPARAAQDRLTLVGSVGMPLYAALPRIYNPLAATARGLKRTVLWLRRAYANLSQLVTGEVSTKAVGGPVSIVQWSFNLAAQGVGTLMDFFGMLSIFVAVLNFLPIPPFDGGHVLFVLFEKVKGSHINLKFRTAVWIVGWVAVGLLFLVVMYRDIARLLS